MTLARARIIVTLSGLLAIAAIIAALTVFGGPQDARRSARDSDRLSDLLAIASALECHRRSQAEPSTPTALQDVSPACLAPGPGAELVDPRTGAPYRIEPIPDGTTRICATFERPDRPPYRTPANFDSISGCLVAGQAQTE